METKQGAQLLGEPEPARPAEHIEQVFIGHDPVALAEKAKVWLQTNKARCGEPLVTLSISCGRHG